MKKLFLVLALLPVAVLILFFALSLLTKSDAAAGVVDGRLTPCPDKPNCVSSEYPDDAAHSIAPFAIPAGMEDRALSLVKEAILELGGSVQSETETYLAATFTSSFFRFVDDVEVRLDTAGGVLHIRSASRAGYSDMDVNRQRAEAIRALFARKAGSD